MKKTFYVFSFVFAFFALTTIVSAQRVKDTPVTSTINDVNSYTLFDIRSDGLGGPYLNGTTDSVVSRIQSIGDWELNMLNSPTRTAYINFGTAPVASGYYPVRFLAQCPADLRNLGINQAQNCKMVVAVNVGSDRYSIRFGYVTGTNQTTWTCNALTNVKCSSWRMVSDPSNQGGKITAQLLKITTVKGKETATPIGLYSFSFDVTVMNQ
ncbi:MAG: hypothetical protein M3Q99_10070 [Acidobacteriota bacterium]|nr:hypothetical protein [Acidobacteriota bacterium]